MLVPSSLGLELKARREAAGLTQQAVADQLGVSRPTLTQWEGDRYRPTLEHLSRLDEIYGARGEIVRLAQAARTGEDAARPQRRRFLADIFRDVADALVDTLVEAKDGRPLGWSHNLSHRAPTPLSTAFVVRTLQLLDDARVDLHGLADVLERRRTDAGWSNRSTVDTRPEVTAVVLAALSRLGKLTDVDESLRDLEVSLDDFALSRPFVLAVVLESLLAIRPDAPLVGRLIRVLLDARRPHEDLMLWPMDAAAPPGLVEPSLAHTARATAVLRLARPATDRAEVDEAVDMAIGWIVARQRSDDGTTEILRPTPANRAADIPIHHFTSAWCIRAMAGIEGVPAHRLQTSLDVLWGCYSPTDRLWAWRADGSLPSWMTHDAVGALWVMAVTSLPTPVTTTLAENDLDIDPGSGAQPVPD